MTHPDTKCPEQPTVGGSGLPRHIHLLALICALATIGLAFSLPLAPWDGEDISPETEEITLLNLPLPEAVSSEPLGNDDTDVDLEQGSWRTAAVRPGDNLFLIFSRLGLRTEDLYSLISTSDEARQFERVQPGQVFRIRTDANGNLAELVHQTDEIRGLRVVREGELFKFSEFLQDIEKRTAFSTGEIDTSLYQSAAEAGLSDKVIMGLVKIFGWDIDFALDIRPGDRFTVLYDQDFLNGEKIGDGDILAAEFTNQGRTYRAVRYSAQDGASHYYTPEGRSLRQAFLRSPVDFRRISSHFQPTRWHPVLGTRRPHRGVDYAAPIGTPIKASGDGKVAFIGRKGGYGKTIILLHGQRYSTLYAHLSAFKSGLRNGARITQGEIIGYVGQTGLATGPHLHYEFRIDGTHVNPVTVKLPGAVPIESAHMADFQKQIRPLIAKLQLYSRARLAMNLE